MIAPRLSRGLCLLLGLGLLAGACSHKPSPATAKPVVPTQAASPTETVAAPPTVTASGAPASAAPAPTRRSSPTPTNSKPAAVPTAPPAPLRPPATPAGAAVSLPKLGTYVYDLSGTTQSPLLGLPQSYPSGATLSTNFSAATPRAGGTEVVSRGTSSQDQAQTTTKWLFQPSKVLLTFSNLTFLGLASYDCTYAPAPEILPIPLQATTLPTQSWSGAQCTGSLQLTVTGLETVSAAGQAWNVWRVHTAVHYVAQSSVDATLDTTSLFSPELGTVVTSDSTTTGKVAGSPFTSHQVTSLKSHP